ncbi:hypothetical protein [Nonomuraea jabiensis]|uniref:hypothetical protein n=1 Tax=Nonomuraea jabiensis TaxID=882448 RepID=UPI003694A3E1
MSRMRDVLGTIQADQDVVIRAGSRGALVVDGGPGTGKIVVALHRSAGVRSLTPELAKGLEFDLVVLVDPEEFGNGIEGAVDRSVAMIRATRRLVILTCS